MATWLARLPRGLQSLLDSLGIAQPPGSQLAFDLVGNVVPVALVEPSILQVTVTTPAFGTPDTAGATSVPAVGTILADTGALVAGDWDFLIFLSAVEANTSGMEIQHRNAANAANIWSHRWSFPSGVFNLIVTLGKTIAADERVRVLNNVAGGAGSVYQATIFKLLR